MARCDFPDYLACVLERVCVYINGQRVLGPNSIPEIMDITIHDLSTLELVFEEGELDPGRIHVLVDYDEHLGGYPIKFFRAEYGKLLPETPQMNQFLGQKFIGKCTFALSYDEVVLLNRIFSVNFRPSQETADKIAIMRQELQDENISVFDFYSIGHMDHLLKHQFLSGAASARFELLHWILDAVMPILNRITTEPVRALQKVTVHKSVERVGNITVSMLNQAIKYVNDWQLIDHLDGQSFLPKSLPVDINVVSYDNPENRFLVLFIKELLSEITMLKEQMHTEIEQLILRSQGLKGSYHEWIVEQIARARRGNYFLEHTRSVLQEFIETTFLREVSPALFYSNRSHFVTLHPLYCQIYELSHSFHQVARVVEQVIPVDERSLPMRTRSISVLYEYWVAMSIVRTLRELGFQPTKKNGYTFSGDEKSFNNNLKENGVIEMSDQKNNRLAVWYSKRYPRLEMDHSALCGAHPYQIEGTLQCKDCPDIAIEYFQQDSLVPKIITLDATFSRSPQKLKEKMYYADTIRSRKYLSQPASEWDFPVYESWAVYPDEYYPNTRRNRGGGEFGLLPGKGAHERLNQWLNERLNTLLGCT